MLRRGSQQEGQSATLAQEEVELSGSERESKSPCRALGSLTSRQFQRVRERFQNTKSPKVKSESECRHGDQE